MERQDAVRGTPRQAGGRAAALSRGALVMALAILPGAGRAAAPFDDAGCPSCHGALAKRKYVHTGFSAGSCSDCHLPAAGAGKCRSPVSAAWKPVAPDPELCAGCHDMKGKAATVHPALELGCTNCHDPHSSPNPNQLVRWPVADLCAGCHGPQGGQAAVHSAVKQGLCLGCHDPHASPNPKLLRRTGNDLCLECHDARKAGKPGAAAVVVDLGRKDVHPALEAAECMDCHAPHGSPWAWQLRQPLPALCYGCHERQDGERHVHGAVALGRCNVCHDPHASDNDKLLRDARPADLCFRCHSDDVNGRKHVHTPVAMGECLLCHRPHGSPNAANLEKPVPALCLGCHDGLLAGKNVHPAVDRFGCTACHDPHGSANDFQLLASGNDLCLKCHPRITGDHVFVTFDGRAHPLSGKPDPSHPGKSLGCTSCHSPHSSDNPRLFLRGKSRMEVCDGCHAKH